MQCLYILKKLAEYRICFNFRILNFNINPPDLVKIVYIFNAIEKDWGRGKFFEMCIQVLLNNIIMLLFISIILLVWVESIHFMKLLNKSAYVFIYSCLKLSSLILISCIFPSLIFSCLLFQGMGRIIRFPLTCWQADYVPSSIVI